MALFGHYEVQVLDAAGHVVRSAWRVATTGAPVVGQTHWFENRQFLVVHVDNREQPGDDGGTVYTYPSVHLRERKPTLLDDNDNDEDVGKNASPASLHGVATVIPFSRPSLHSPFPAVLILAIAAQGYAMQKELFTHCHRLPSGTIWFVHNDGKIRRYTRDELWSLSRDAQNGLEDLLTYAAERSVSDASTLSSDLDSRLNQPRETVQSNEPARAKLRLV